MTRILSILIALTAPAMADCYPVTLPPSQYDHPLIVKFIDYRVSYWDVNSVCRGFGEFPNNYGRLEGCVIPGRIDGVPIRVVPSDQDQEFTACIIRHENGHINGWPGDHPGARYE